MTTDVTLRGFVPSVAAAAREVPKDAMPTAVFKTLGDQASSLRTRRGQTIGLTLDGGEAAFFVRAGVLILRVAMPALPRHIVMLLFAGDVLTSGFVPPACDADLTAASTGEIWRLRHAALRELTRREGPLGAYVEKAIARKTAWQTIHATALAQFDCEQRVATFLVEVALRTGLPAAAGGVTTEMPLSRKEIADYLGLNADTLSRVMARLRGAGVLTQSERSRILIRDFRALASRSPASRAVMATHPDSCKRLALAAEVLDAQS